MGSPLDRLLATYLLIASAAFAFPYRPSSWPWLLAVHVAAAAVLWPASRVGRASLDRARPAAGESTATGSGAGALHAVADWAPLLLMPLLYAELAVLNRAVHGGRYFDELVIGWEQALFGGMPSTEWAAAMPSLRLSEPLHFAYLSYYFIIFVPPLLLFLRGRRDAFRAGVFTLMFSFLVHYIFFIYFPVQGPRYLFPHGSTAAAGFFEQLAHRVLEAGSSQGAAFPSSHVGVSVTQTLIAMRCMPRISIPLAVLTTGLAAGAVYGGFHYAIDALAGTVLGIAAFFAGSRLYAAAARPATTP
ncbi:MAG: phosphatase PAP2 family protein [Gemmatimonadota bacterium]